MLSSKNKHKGKHRKKASKRKQRKQNNKQNDKHRKKASKGKQRKQNNKYKNKSNVKTNIASPDRVYKSQEINEHSPSQQPPRQPPSTTNKGTVSYSTVRKVQEFYGFLPEETAMMCKGWNIHHDVVEIAPDVHVCRNCSSQNAKTRCGGCKKVYYCNKDCQRADWKTHKPTCKLSIQEHDKHTECDFIEKCPALYRLIEVLKCYQQQKDNKVSQYFNMNKHSIINDYHHILSTHLNEDNEQKLEHNKQFQLMYEKLINNDLYCDISSCAKYKRNNREREKDIKNRNSSISFGMEFLDCVHCHFLHSVDVGYTIFDEPKQDDANDENKNENDIGWDEQLFVLKTYLKTKRQNLEKIRGASRMANNKFVTDVTEGYCNDEEAEEKNQTADKHARQDYSFGLRYNCWNGYINESATWNKRNDINLTQKYASLKEELLSNGIYTLETNVFRSAYNKAQCLLHESNVVKHIRSNKNCSRGERVYEVQPRSPLTINHILSIVLYTDYDTLSYNFSSIFRTPQTSLKYLKQRGSEYYHWIKILTETVDCFGTEMQASSINRFYHGISVLYFDKFVAQFDAPTSTTTKLQVAAIFATNDGMILELAQHNEWVRYFNCSFISYFANEDEKLFIQPAFAQRCSLKLVGIRMMKTNQYYEHFINVLAIFHQLVNNGNSSLNIFRSSGLHEEVPSDCVDTINDFMDVSLNVSQKEFPDYIVKCFKKWSDKIIHIYLFINDIKKYCKGFKIWSLNSNLIQYDKLNKVFAKIEAISCFQTGCINKSDLSSLLSMIILVNSIKYSKLWAIRLMDAEFMFSKSEFAQLFAEIGWDMICQPGCLILRPMKYKNKPIMI